MEKTNPKAKGRKPKTEARNPNRAAAESGIVRGSGFLFGLRKRLAISEASLLQLAISACRGAGLRGDLLGVGRIPLSLGQWHRLCTLRLRHSKYITKKGHYMLGLTVTFLLIALIAGLLGFTGIAGAAAGIAQILFIIFLVLFLASLVSHLLRAR